MDSDIPLPEGAPTRNFSQDNQQKEKEPEPMAAPDETDETYKNLQEQAMQHVHGTTTSPTTEQLQQQLAVTHYAMPVSLLILNFSIFVWFCSVNKDLCTVFILSFEKVIGKSENF